MKLAHLPRTLIIFSLFLIAVTFLAGVLHAFDTARAASITPAAPTSHSVVNKLKITPTPVPTVVSVSVSGDTTGITALAILIVIIVLVGATMGTNRPVRKKIS